MKRKLLVAVPLLYLVGTAGVGIAAKTRNSGRGVRRRTQRNLWSSVAQVREQLGVLLYGDHVEVLARRNDNVKVRTSGGMVGWVEGRYLMEPELWQRSEKLLQQAKAMPVQARGRTKVSTNLRAKPAQGRAHTIPRGVQVEIVGRAVADGCR